MPTYNAAATIFGLGTSGWQKVTPQWNDAWVSPRNRLTNMPRPNAATSKPPREGINLTFNPDRSIADGTRSGTARLLDMRMGTVSRNDFGKGASYFQGSYARAGSVLRSLVQRASNSPHAKFTRRGNVMRADTGNGWTQVIMRTDRAPEIPGIQYVSSWNPAILKPRALTATPPEISEVLIGEMQALLQMEQDWLTYISETPLVLPAPPVTPTPGTIPAAGGMIVRALYGKVVDMNTPTIIDGKPT